MHAICIWTSNKNKKEEEEKYTNEQKTIKYTKFNIFECLWVCLCMFVCVFSRYYMFFLLFFHKYTGHGLSVQSSSFLTIILAQCAVCAIQIKELCVCFLSTFCLNAVNLYIYKYERTFNQFYHLQLREFYNGGRMEERMGCTQKMGLKITKNFPIFGLCLLWTGINCIWSDERAYWICFSFVK